MCGDRRRRCWAETWDSGDAGGGRRRCWDRFCISDDAVEAYRRQRYRSWSSADAEGAFCVVCVQFLALCRRWAQQASLLGQVLDCRRRRECTQWCWSASVWQLGAAEEGLCGVVPPKDWQVGATEGTLWALPVLACRGRAVSFTFSITHRIKPHGPYAPKCEEPVSLTSAYMPAIRLICAVRLAGVSG